MMVSNRGSVLRLMLWQWRSVALYAAAAALIVVTLPLHATWFKLPTLPVAVAGGALGIFVSFRTNSAYARWWEGRQLWGRLINTSRHFCSQALVYLSGAPSGLAERLVLRHLAYVNVLRCALRGQDPAQDSHVQAYLRESGAPSIEGETNATHALLHLQLEDLTRASDEHHLDAYRLQSFDASIRALLDIQGGCERIKKTPMPRGYGFIAERLIQALSLLFPFTIVYELGWLAVPVNVLVCLAFALISEAGRVLEDPFTMFWNGLPLSAMSRTIEANLLQRLGREALPAIPGPDARGILM